MLAQLHRSGGHNVSNFGYTCQVCHVTLESQNTIERVCRFCKNKTREEISNTKELLEKENWIDEAEAPVKKIEDFIFRKKF